MVKLDQLAHRTVPKGVRRSGLCAGILVGLMINSPVAGAAVGVLAFFITYLAVYIWIRGDFSHQSVVASGQLHRKFVENLEIEVKPSADVLVSVLARVELQPMVRDICRLPACVVGAILWGSWPFSDAVLGFAAVLVLGLLLEWMMTRVVRRKEVQAAEPELTVFLEAFHPAHPTWFSKL